MKQSNKDLSKVFFNSVEEMSECYGTDTKLPSKLYSKADLVCYEIVEPFVYEYLGQYVFTDSGFYHLGNIGEPVIYDFNSVKLELEVYEDDVFKHEGCCFVYVRVNDYLRKHSNISLLGCEFIHKYSDPFSSERRFISSIYSKNLVLDQDGVFSSIDNILLYPDDYSDPIPYKEWVKKINEQDVDED